MKTIRSFCGLLALTAFFTTVFFMSLSGRAETDVPGQDLPYLSRFPGSVRTEFKKSDFDQFTFTGEFSTEKNEYAYYTEEGKYYYILYRLSGSSVSRVELFRNYQNALKKANWTMVYVSEPGLLTIKKKMEGAEVWAQVAFEIMNENENATFEYDIALTVIEKAGMKQQLELDASAMKKALDEKGRIAVYGINFDTGKATIRPESQKILAEIGKLLQDNPELKLSIEGHTDNVGKDADNQKLSEQRSAAVKDYLVKNFKIATERLTTAGFGKSKPVADNGSEEGRAKNRRVELVKK